MGDAHRFTDPIFSFGVFFSAHEARLAAAAGLALCPAAARLLSETVFNNIKLLLHDDLAPTTQAVGVGRGLECGGNFATWAAAARTL